jgi:hypothetical protein
LLAYSDAPTGNAHRFASAVGCFRGATQQESSQARQSIIGACKHPEIVPRIEIVFDRQQENIRSARTLMELGAIRVLLPPHVPQQSTIGGTKRDEIATAPVVWTEHEFADFQLRESALDVEAAQGRAIAPDSDHLVVAELRDRFDRILETGGKASARLRMNMRIGHGRRQT